MGFFGKILEKLGLKKEAEVVAPAAAPAKPAAPAAVKPVAPAAAKPAVQNVAPASTITKMEAPKPVAVSEVDVVNHLEKLSAGSGLDWKVSIVDLLKLLEIDSSREARNELATELGCPADLMKDSAKMNVWLHKTVLKKIAENGGNIPANLLD
jgi:3-oxoacyl-ACP reductase-like protein